MDKNQRFALGLVLVLLVGRVQPALAQHEWDHFSIADCVIMNAGDSILKFDTAPELVPGLNYTCPIWPREYILTNPRTGQIQYFGGEYNRNFQHMDGGHINASAGIDTWACPVPGDDSAWFILEHYAEAHFSKIDMRQDSGLGAVTLLNQNFAYTNSEYSVIVPHSDGYHYWFIMPGSFWTNPYTPSDTLYSYLIGPDGPILPPVISKISGTGGFMYPSPDGSVLAEYDLSNDSELAILHIDQKSGKVTFAHEINIERWPAAGAQASPLAFSPNGKLLYVLGSGFSDSTTYLLQYNLSQRDYLNQSDSVYIVEAVKVSDTSGLGADMALAGNGKIYGPGGHAHKGKDGFWDAYLFCINSPDSIGEACDYSDTAVNVGVGLSAGGLWNGVPRIRQSGDVQITSLPLATCTSSCFTFSRPDTGGFPHWTFEGGSPATANGPVVQQVCFDSAGLHNVYAVTSTGDTVYDMVVAGEPYGTGTPLAASKTTVTPGSIDTVPVQIKLSYANGGPAVTGDTIGHVLQEYEIEFDTSILSLPANPVKAILLPPQDEVYSARQTGNVLKLLIEDTTNATWMISNGNIPWRDTMNKFSVVFHVAPTDVWKSTNVTLDLFSIDDGLSTRYDFCPQENNLLATITNANAGVSQPATLENVTLYPNPTMGVVTISGASGAVVVENVLGEAVLGGNSTGTTPQPPPLPLRSRGGGVQLDLSSLPAGTYFVRVETPSGIVVKSVIKE